MVLFHCFVDAVSATAVAVAATAEPLIQGVPFGRVELNERAMNYTFLLQHGLIQKFNWSVIIMISCKSRDIFLTNTKDGTVHSCYPYAGYRIVLL